MKWPWRRKPTTDEGMRRADVAEDRVRALKVRADRVAPALEGRRARNHWAEAIAALYQEGRP